MAVSRSIDLDELNAIIDGRGVPTWLSWRNRPREPRVAYGFGCLPERSAPPAPAGLLIGPGQRISEPGQATIEGGGGFRGGEAARVRIATRNGDDYDVFRVTSTVKHDLSIVFTDLTTVAEVAERIIEFHHRCVADFDQHAAERDQRIAEGYATLDSVLGAMLGVDGDPSAGGVLGALFGGSAGAGGNDKTLGL